MCRFFSVLSAEEVHVLRPVSPGWYSANRLTPVPRISLECLGGDDGKLYVTTAGFSSGFNYLGTDNNIEEQGPCQGLLLGGGDLTTSFLGL